METIRTARLRLDPMAEGDVEELHSLWTDPGVRRFLWDDETIPIETARAVVAASVETFARRGFGLWSARIEGEAGIAGFAGLRFPEDSPEVEVLFGFFPRHWGKGLALEAAVATMRQGFEGGGLERIGAGADAPNAASLRVIEKLGMTETAESAATKPAVRKFSIGRAEFERRFPNQPPTGPLAGIRVLDFCSAVAGGYSASLMGDMGADVIKIEPPEGDAARQWGPFFHGEGKMFQGWNRNKRSLAIDLRSEIGREAIRRLARKADLVIENFRPGVAERLAIDEATLRAINPRIIYCSVTGFGASGPWKSRPAYDPILQALSGGAAAAAGTQYAGTVSISSFAAVDYATAFILLGAALAALYHRAATGEGQRVETSLLQGAMATQAHSFFQPLAAAAEGASGIYPNRLFKAKGGHIHIIAPTNKFWAILCEAIGLPELARDEAYATNKARSERADELTARIEARLEERTPAEWEKIFIERDLPCGAVMTYDEFFASEQVAATNMNPVIEHSAIGPVRVPGPAFGFSKSPSAIQRATPKLGEHNAEILGEIGIGED